MSSWRKSHSLGRGSSSGAEPEVVDLEQEDVVLVDDDEVMIVEEIVNVEDKYISVIDDDDDIQLLDSVNSRRMEVKQESSGSVHQREGRFSGNGNRLNTGTDTNGIPIFEDVNLLDGREEVVSVQTDDLGCTENVQNEREQVMITDPPAEQVLEGCGNKLEPEAGTSSSSRSLREELDVVANEVLNAEASPPRHDNPHPPPSTDDKEEDARLVYLSEPDLYLKEWTPQEIRKCSAAIRQRLTELSASRDLMVNYNAQFPPFPPPEDPKDPYPRQLLEEDENGHLTWLMCRAARLRSMDETDFAAGRNKWGFKLPEEPTLTFGEIILSDLPEGILPVGFTAIPTQNPNALAKLNDFLVKGEEMLRRKPMMDMSQEPDSGPDSPISVASSPSLPPSSAHTSSTNSTGKFKYMIPSYFAWLFMTDEEKQENLEECRKYFGFIDDEMLIDKNEKAGKEEAEVMRSASRFTVNTRGIIRDRSEGVECHQSTRRTRLGTGVLPRRSLAETELFPEDTYCPSQSESEFEEEEAEESGSEFQGSTPGLPNPLAARPIETQANKDGTPKPSTSTPVIPPSVTMPKPIVPEHESSKCPIDNPTGWVKGDLWEVEKIVDSTLRKDLAGNERVVYKVKWSGWGPEHNSWEDQDHVSKTLVKDYWRNIALKIDELNAPIKDVASPVRFNNLMPYLIRFGNFRW